MKKILRCFGFISLYDLISSAEKFDKKQMEIKNDILMKALTENSRDIFLDGLEEGWQGIGALRFVREFLENKNND